MSPAAAAVRDASSGRAGPVRAPAPRPRQRPRLTVVVAPPPVRSRGPFALTCAGVLVGTLVSLLLLNIALSRGAYQVHELEQRRAGLAERQQALTERLAAEAAPGRLAERATALGMVNNPNPVFLRLSDGAVLGSPTPAPAPPPPPPPTPAPTASAPTASAPAASAAPTAPAAAAPPPPAAP